MELLDFYKKHFSNLCCYEDYLMRIDLMGKSHNDKEILDSLPTCYGHMYIVAGGEVIWIDDNGEKVENPNITSIPDYTFSFCDEIRRIVIPDSVTFIGEDAFYNCRGLESVTIPNGVTSIEMGAFNGCCGLTSITVPSSMTSIEERVFAGCEMLESVIIPSSVTSIGDGAFYGCRKLKSVKVPKGCKIGSYAFPINCKIMYN